MHKMVHTIFTMKTRTLKQTQEVRDSKQKFDKSATDPLPKVEIFPD